MNTVHEVATLIDAVLGLGGRGLSFGRETPLLGAVPEMDSMAVVSLMTALEERFGITIEDDEISGETFASVGSLADFVSARLAD